MYLTYFLFKLIITQFYLKYYKFNSARAFSYGVGTIYSKENIDDFSLKYPNPSSAMKMENYHGNIDIYSFFIFAYTIM